MLVVPARTERRHKLLPGGLQALLAARELGEHPVRALELLHARQGRHEELLAQPAVDLERLVKLGGRLGER